MPSHGDFHGNTPAGGDTALLLIDVINDLEFAEGDALLQFALPMAEALVTLKRRMRAAGLPTVYVNDNFGRWRSDFKQQVAHCLNDGVRGEPLARLLEPDEEDYFVLKPKHSGFFSTSLDLLLTHMQTRRLILAGVATNICVQFTANDAYLRGYQLSVPADCSAANTLAAHRTALSEMESLLKADIRPSGELPLSPVESQDETGGIKSHRRDNASSASQP
ncbi:MAG: cysteine hydrolase [Planctomycetaceae bacterium]|nr:cysteine hydrolase [Planctomycetaceae bacterium]